MNSNIEEKIVYHVHNEINTKFLQNLKKIKENVIAELRELEQFKILSHHPESIYINIWKNYIQRSFSKDILFKYLIQIVSFNNLDYYFQIVAPYNLTLSIAVVFLLLNSPKKYTDIDKLLIKLSY